MSNFLAAPRKTVQDAVATAQKPPQAPPKVSPTPALDAVTKAPKPDLSEPPLGPPVPVLQQQYGFQGGIGNFNQRLQAVVDAHVKATGYKPDPQTALHAAVSTPPHMAANLFKPQTTSTIALANHPPVSDSVFVQQMRKAAQGDGWDQWLEDNGDRVQQLADDKQWAAKVHGIVLARNSFDSTVNRAKAAGADAAQAKQAAQHYQGLVGTSQEHELAASMLDNNWISGLFGAGGQIANALVHSPGGLYTVAKSVGLDTYDLTANPSAPHPYARTAKVAKAIGKGTAQDFEHPDRNAGYLFLDLLGLASLGAGAAARGVAAAGKVGELGDEASLATKAGTAVKTFAKKPPLQRVTLRTTGGYEEEMPLSSNPLVAYAQKKILGVRQEKAEARLAGDAPAPLRSIVLPDAANEFLDGHLSFERKVGREADARQRVDHTANMALANELDAAAGTALAQSRVLGRLPVTVKNGLTRGEQKAIQVLSWDDPNPLEAERAFHRKMVEIGQMTGAPGFVKNHMQQLADLKLAEEALKNPRPRFQQALDLTRQVVAEMQRMKIEELGLAPETAEGRVAKAGRILRDEPLDATENVERVHKSEIGTRNVLPKRVSDESFYLPTQRRGKVKRQPSQIRGKFNISAGPYGIPAGRDMPELTHEFTGDALRAGDIRIDATSLASEAYARTVRAVTVKNQWNKLWQTASLTKRSDWDIPIRDSNTIPDKLREVVAKIDEGAFTQAEAELLPKDMADLIRALYPDERDLSPEEIDGVRWVDQRLLGDSLGPVHVPGLGAKVANLVNAPFRFLALYLRPAYALNKLGNAAMLIFDQGFLNSGVNLARAMRIEETDGARNAATIRALVGAGRSRSYVTSSSGKVSRAVAEFWNRFADRDERVAAFTYYADRKGYRTPEERDKLLNDQALRGDLQEVTRRANKSLVEFDNLSPVEKNYLRHIIFVYPWVRGSAVWSLRAVMEHPAKVDLLAHLGKEELQTDPLLDKAPAWFKRIGYFPVGWTHNGLPKVANPTSINTFTTLGDFLAIGKAGTVGDKYASASDLFGPASSFFTHASLGRDEYGNQYPGSQWLGAAKEVLAGLPQVAKLKGAKPGKPPTPFDIRDRPSLEASINSGLHETVFQPGWLDGYGSLLIGGLSDQVANPAALYARQIKDMTAPQKAKLELNLLNRALTMQGTFLAKPVPAELRKSVRDQAAITLAYQQFANDHGRTPTLKEKAQLTLDYLAGKGRVPAADAKKLAGQLKPLTDGAAISEFHRALIDKYAAGKQLRQWDSDVRLLYSFKKDTFNEKAAGLFAQGLSPQKRYQVPQEKLTEYGRKYLKWADEVKEARKNGASAADLRLLSDEHSKPVDGLPSFAALAWANQTPQEQQHALASDASAGWDTLTAVEKQLLGKPVDPTVTEAWTAYEKLTSPEALAKQLPAGERSLDKDQRIAVVKQIDKYYGLGGKFTQDYLFSKQPLYQRLQYLDVVKDSPHKAGWHELFQQAATLVNAVKNKQTSSAAASDAWRDYTAELEQYYKTERPAFWKELKPMIDANPGFLAGLIR